MFDDPNKELNRLQENLLADDFDLEGLEDLLKDYDTEDRIPAARKEEPKVEKPKAEKVFKRPAATKKQADELSDMLLDEEEDDFEDEEVFDEDDFADEAVAPAKAKKEKGVGGLIALCIAETLAIVGLLAWWILCLR